MDVCDTITGAEHPKSFGAAATYLGGTGLWPNVQRTAAVRLNATYGTENLFWKKDGLIAADNCGTSFGTSPLDAPLVLRGENSH